MFLSPARTQSRQLRGRQRENPIGIPGCRSLLAIRSSSYPGCISEGKAPAYQIPTAARGLGNVYKSVVPQHCKRPPVPLRARSVGLAARFIWQISGCLRSTRSFGPHSLAAAILTTMIGLTGCETYHPVPLPQGTDLATSLADLKVGKADEAVIFRIDTTHSLTIDQIGVWQSSMIRFSNRSAPQSK